MIKVGPCNFTKLRLMPAKMLEYNLKLVHHMNVLIINQYLAPFRLCNRQNARSSLSLELGSESTFCPTVP